MAAALSSDAGAQAANLALRIGSNAADAISFAVELGEELPLISPVLKTLTAIREKVETVNSNREGLTALEVRCSYITACVVVKCRQNSRSEMDVAPLTDCVKAIGGFVERCVRRGRVSRVLKASSDKDEIAGLNARVDRLTGDLGLAGIALLEGKTDDVKAMLERMSKNQDIIVDHLQRPPVKLAKIPKGTPARKSWHVERRHVMESVFEALSGDCRPCLVGLVGGSGAGKTTAASEIVRSTEMREVFSDGVVWLTVNDGAKKRLPALMMQLARMVYEDIGGSVGSAPSGSGDGAAYINQYMKGGHGGKGFRCLVVADNVWEEEVVSKLLETGMWVLISTRDQAVVTGPKEGMAVGVDELSKADAKSVLRKAAELSPEVDLPDDAVDLMELCGRVAMDLAFVGRWSTVRGRQDRTAWSEAAGKVRAEMANVEGDPSVGVAEKGPSRRRKAILRAGFENLAIESDDERVQRLYLSLGVLPDGHAFTVKDAAVLLYDRTPSAEDETSVRVVVEILERWSVLRSSSYYVSPMHYTLHDAHSSFARENLMDRGDVRWPALKRWVRYISSLETIRCFDRHALKGLWLAVEQMGGDGWAETRPYAMALARVQDSDPLFWEKISAVAEFQELQDDLDGAIVTCRRIREACEVMLGPEHEDVASSLLRLFVLVEEAGRLEEAEELMRRCVEFAESKDDPECPEQVAHALLLLGICVQAPGRLEEAEMLLRRSLAIEEAELGPEDEGLVSTLHQLGVCVRQAGRLVEAEELLRRCLAIEEAELGPEDEWVSCTLYHLGTCVREAGRLEEAEELLTRSLKIGEAQPKPEDIGLARTLHQLSLCVRDAGRAGEAEEMWRRVLGILEASLSRQDAEVGNAVGRQWRKRLRQREWLEKAKNCLKECIAINEAELGSRRTDADKTLQDLNLSLQEACQLR